MKKQIISTILASALVLGSNQMTFAEELVVGVPAEQPVVTEVAPVESTPTTTEASSETVVPTGSEGVVIGDSASTEPATETAPAETGIEVAPAPVTEPVEPSSPSEPVEVEEDAKPASEDAVIGQAVTDKEDSSKDETSGNSEQSIPEQPVQPTIPIASSSVTPAEIKAAEANTGISSTADPLPVTVAAFESPVVTNTGFEIVSTENSQVLIRTESGAIEKKEAVSVGAVKQSDGTIAVKDKEGKLQVLPSTGEASDFASAIFGFVNLALASVYGFSEKIKGLLKK